MGPLILRDLMVLSCTRGEIAVFPVKLEEEKESFKIVPTTSPSSTKEHCSYLCTWEVNSAPNNCRCGCGFRNMKLHSKADLFVFSLASQAYKTFILINVEKEKEDNRSALTWISNNFHSFFIPLQMSQRNETKKRNTGVCIHITCKTQPKRSKGLWFLERGGFIQFVPFKLVYRVWGW